MKIKGVATLELTVRARELLLGKMSCLGHRSIHTVYHINGLRNKNTINLSKHDWDILYPLQIELAIKEIKGCTI